MFNYETTENNNNFEEGTMQYKLHYTNMLPTGKQVLFLYAVLKIIIFSNYLPFYYGTC